MMHKLILYLTIIAAMSAPVYAASSRKGDGKRAKAVVGSKPAETTGDDVFQANCSRCHMPPMSISPRTAGTVIMHMRTRARLSREDEIKLLRFMAP
jgi:cytochrome c5